MSWFKVGMPLALVRPQLWAEVLRERLLGETRRCKWAARWSGGRPPALVGSQLLDCFFKSYLADYLRPAHPFQKLDANCSLLNDTLPQLWSDGLLAPLRASCNAKVEPA